MIYPISSPPPRLYLGAQGDKDVTEIAFDVAAWRVAIPSGEFTINFKNAQKQFDVSGVTLQGNILTWVVGADVTQFSGEGSVVISAVADGIRKCTFNIGTMVSPGHVLPEVKPAPVVVTTLPAANPARLGQEIILSGIKYRCIVSGNKYMWEGV